MTSGFGAFFPAELDRLKRNVVSWQSNRLPTGQGFFLPLRFYFAFFAAIDWWFVRWACPLRPLCPLGNSPSPHLPCLEHIAIPEGPVLARLFSTLQVLVTEVTLAHCVVCRLCFQVLEFNRESTTPVDAVRAETNRKGATRTTILRRPGNEHNGTKAGDRRFRLHCRRAPFCRISLPFPSVVLSRPDCFPPVHH